MRLDYWIASQMRKPSGLLGYVVGIGLALNNRRASEWVVSILNIQPTDHVLEIGFGPGLAIQAAAASATQGWVVGVDFSKTMLRQATRRNARAIKEGRVTLEQADAAQLAYSEVTFDKVFAINVIYFWPDPTPYLREMLRVLKPGGSLGIYLVPENEVRHLKYTQTSVYNMHTPEQVAELLKQQGLTRIRFEARMNMPFTGICVLAEKPASAELRFADGDPKPNNDRSRTHN